VKTSQQDLVLGLHAQGQWATEIHHHLVQAFGELAIAYSTVSITIRGLSLVTPDEEAHDLGGRPLKLMIDARIQQFLIDNPGGSIRQIATGTGIPALTVWHDLMTSLGHVCRKYRLVTHTLSEAQRIEKPNEVRCFLSLCAGRNRLLGVSFRQVTSAGPFATVHTGFLPM
jgi:hypothetical protein